MQTYKYIYTHNANAQKIDLYLSLQMLVMLKPQWFQEELKSFKRGCLLCDATKNSQAFLKVSEFFTLFLFKSQYRNMSFLLLLLLLLFFSSFLKILIFHSNSTCSFFVTNMGILILHFQRSVICKIPHKVCFILYTVGTHCAYFYLSSIIYNELR